MKNFITIFSILFIFGCSKTKVPKITSGVVNYKITLDTQEDIDPEKFGSKATVTFNSTMLHFEKTDGVDNGTFQLIESATGKETNYLEFKDSKYALESTSDMVPPVGELVYQKEKKMIAGYNCQKAVATMGDGELVGWFTKDIGVNFCPYASAKGFALEYTLEMPFGKVTYSALDVNLKPVDEKIFQPSPDYKKVTMDELKDEIMGGSTATAFDKGSTLTNYEWKDMDGKIVQLNELKGKVVLINFWFINCAPCRYEMPDLNQLKKDYAGKGVEFLAITFDPKSNVADFLGKTDFDFQIIPDARKAIEEYGIQGFPTSVVLDKTGKVVNSKMGGSMNIKEELAAFIEEALTK